MHCHWLHRNSSNTGCILFMAGWGMDPAPFAGLSLPGHDLLMVYGYTDPEPPPLTLLAGYRQRRLLAWSMGVWAAACLLRPPPSFFTSCTALAGTLQPIHDRCGIPVSAFEAILATLDQKAADAFYRSMFDDPDQARRFFANRPHRSAADLRTELAWLKAACLGQGPGPDIFDQRIITSRDRIFPARNQKRSWRQAATGMRKWPHFPFYREDFWPGILGEDPVDTL
ncbi:MAG TPA: DUF452 family protein [Desulfobulbus sp.]|nr:DUF452 family protein [Desulfobulbus sp.]